MKSSTKHFLVFLISIFLLFGCTQENSSPTQLKFHQGSIPLDNSTVSTAVLSKSSTTAERYSVKIKLKEDAAETLKRYTSENIGKTFDVITDGKTIQSPTIMSAVGREFLIDGLTKEQANSITKNFTCTTDAAD